MYVRSLFHSSQKPTRKLAATTFIQSQCLKALAPSLRIGFCDKWKSRIPETLHAVSHQNVCVGIYLRLVYIPYIHI